MRVGEEIRMEGQGGDGRAYGDDRREGGLSEDGER